MMRPATDATTGDEAVLLYDSHCQVCRQLAHEVRRYAPDRIELVALSEPAAADILSEFYPDGWEHDFYLVEDGVCRKGARSLPRLSRIVGMSEFGSLVGEYATYKLRRRDCEQGCDDHDHDGAGGPDVSRRSFASMLSAAALPVMYPLSKLSDGGPGDRAARPPRDLDVHVARVRPDGRDGFQADVRPCPDCVRPEPFEADESAGKPVDMEVLDEAVLRDASLDGDGTLQVRRTDKSVEPEAVDGKLRQAIVDYGASGGTTTTYHAMADHPRFGVGLNVGHGPAVVDGTPGAATTMSGKIEHDVARQVVDFVTYDGPTGDVATRLEAHRVGFEALGEFYAGRGDGRMADVFAEIADGWTEVSAAFVAAVDDPRLDPVKDHVAVSGIPGFVQYVTPPASRHHQVTGFDCSCSCCVGCCCGCGCGCGCSLCTGCICGCGCCCGECGGGCGCGCCVCGELQ